MIPVWCFQSQTRREADGLTVRWLRATGVSTGHRKPQNHGIFSAPVL